MIDHLRRRQRHGIIAWASATLLLVLVSSSYTDAARRIQPGRRVNVGGFMTPESVSVGSDARHYISDIGQFDVPGDGTIRVISGNPFANTAVVSTFAMGLNDPKGIVFVGTDLFVADQNQVWRILTAGAMTGQRLLHLSPQAFPGGAQFLIELQ
ncbi:MAG: hypothetical protein HY650_02785 [Acidobacteria bacterium]|nr:hypothetical protein [Acidobacteriota bacterium]